MRGRKHRDVIVNVQDGILADVGTGGAPNPDAVATFDADAAMRQVSDFYRHPTRGTGIDVYWVKRPFVPLDGPPIMGRPNAYRYENGDMIYTPKPGSQVQGDLNGSAWISSDGSYMRFLGREARDEYRSVPPPSSPLAV